MCFINDDVSPTKATQTRLLFNCHFKTSNTDIKFSSNQQILTYMPLQINDDKFSIKSFENIHLIKFHNTYISFRKKILAYPFLRISQKFYSPQNWTKALYFIHPVAKGWFWSNNHVRPSDASKLMKITHQRDSLQSFTKTLFIGEKTCTPN